MQFVTAGDQLYPKWYLTQQHECKSYDVCNEKSLNGITCRTSNVKTTVQCHIR